MQHIFFYLLLLLSRCTATFLVEQALGAIQAGEMNITDGVSALKETTSATLLDIIGKSTGTGSLGVVAITATVQALGLAYTSIERSKAARLNEADLFSQACDAGTATFFVPNRPSLTEDEQSFFLTMTKYLRDKDPILVKYANIYVTENFQESNGVKGTSYAIISYANLFLSNAYENIPGDDRILEAAKHSCDLFIKAKLPDMLETVREAQMESHFFTRWFPGTRKFYQRLYFVRFLTIAFGNILISLQHPPTLDNKAVIKLCGQVIDVINEMLLSDRFKFIRTKMKFHNEFVHFLTSMRREVENLQLGYKSKILNEISLFEVVGKCHGILQGLNSLWHEVIFKDRPNTQPDQLLYIVRCITFAVHILDPLSKQTSDYAGNRVVQWISKNKIFPEQLLKYFAPSSATDDTKRSDPVPVSVLEVIKGFSQWLGKQQPGSKKVLELQELGVEINELKLLSSNFTAPMKKLLRDYGVVQANITEKMIPDILEQLIALSIESCPPFLPEKFHGEEVYKSCSQINLERKLADHRVWALLDKSDRNGRQLKNETIQNMRLLLDAQYGFLDAVRLFSKVQAFMEKNRLFLLERQSQSNLQELLALLLKRLDKLRTQMNDLYTAVSQNDRIISVNGEDTALSHNKARKAILSALSEEGVLRSRLDILQADIERILRILTSTKFSERLKTQILEDWSSTVNSGVVGLEQHQLNMEKVNKTAREKEMVEYVEIWNKIYYLPHNERSSSSLTAVVVEPTVPIHAKRSSNLKLFRNVPFRMHCRL